MAPLDAKGETAIKTVVAATAVVISIFGWSSGIASADHAHFVVREDRNGVTHCRYIAEGQTSKQADEPGGHKFHDHVHTGEPGGAQANGRENGTDFDKASAEGRCDEVRHNGRP